MEGGLKMKLLLKFFSEDNGRESSTRLFCAVIVLSAIIDWQHTVWLGTEPWNPNYEVLGLVAYALGIKVWQKKLEEKGKEDKL